MAKEIFTAIEHSGVAQALKSSFFAYPLVSALHILSIGMLLTGVILMDLRILGALRNMPHAPFVALLRRLTLLAFCVAAVTGLAMFSVKAGEYAAMPIFLTKMALICVAAGNFLLFLTLEHRKFGMASPAVRLSAIASMGLWLGVLVCGRFIGFL
jgi:hypothetical protein